MSENFSIEMGNYREDNSIFYSEFIADKSIRELRADVDIVKNLFYYLPIFKPTVILYLDSFKNWNSSTELTSYEYTTVLKRIFNHLDKSGFRVTLG
jgi:hypothetical protein